MKKIIFKISMLMFVSNFLLPISFAQKKEVIKIGAFKLRPKADLGNSITFSMNEEGFALSNLGQYYSLVLESREEFICQTYQNKYQGKNLYINVSDFKFGTVTCKNLSDQASMVLYGLESSTQIATRDLDAYHLADQGIVDQSSERQFFEVREIYRRVVENGVLSVPDVRNYADMFGFASKPVEYRISEGQSFQINIESEEETIEISNVDKVVYRTALLGIGNSKLLNAAKYPLECSLNGKKYSLDDFQESSLWISKTKGILECKLLTKNRWWKRDMKALISFQYRNVKKAEFVEKLKTSFRNWEAFVDEKVSSKRATIKKSLLKHINTDLNNFANNQRELKKMPFEYEKEFSFSGNAIRYEFKAVADRQVTDRGDIYFLSYLVAQKYLFANEGKVGEEILNDAVVKLRTKVVLEDANQANTYSFTRELHPLMAYGLSLKVAKLSEQVLSNNSEIDAIKDFFQEESDWQTSFSGKTTLLRTTFGLCYRLEQKEGGNVERVYDQSFAYYAGSLKQKVSSFNAETLENFSLNYQFKKVKNPITYVDLNHLDTINDFSGYKCETGSDAKFSEQEVVSILIR